MKIKDIYNKKDFALSFEVFPPNDIYNIEDLYSITENLSVHNPDYISVTYGAGGTTTETSLELASHIKNNLNIEVLSHLTCIGAKSDFIEKYLDKLNIENIENILALRGDTPKHVKDDTFFNDSDFKYASDLIQKIKQTDNFSIGAAFYPDTHFENNDLMDLFYLKQKVESGVDFLISQIFFDNEQFYNFMEQANKLNINVPFIPGIIPITNAKQIKKITELCHARVPDKLKKLLDKYENKPECLKEAGIHYVCEQIIDLKVNNIRGIHLYTMNKVKTIDKIMENLQNILND